MQGDRFEPSQIQEADGGIACAGELVHTHTGANKVTSHRSISIPVLLAGQGYCEGSPMHSAGSLPEALPLFGLTMALCTGKAGVLHTGVLGAQRTPRADTVSSRLWPCWQLEVT